MPNSDIILSADAEIGDINNNKGKLIYKINCETDKSNFAINTILKNSGVTKADGAAITATDVTTTPLQIKGGENFFKDKAGGGSNLTRFSLSADAEKASDLATEIKKLDFTQDKYDKYYSYTSSSYLYILRNGTVTPEMFKALGEEADRLIPIARACVEKLGDLASDDLKKLLDYTEKYRNSVTGENYDTLSLKLPSDVESSTISDTIKNRGILLYDACKYADYVVQQCALIALKNANYVKNIRNDTENYQYISDQFDALKTADNSYQAGLNAYNTLINKTLPATSPYSINDIVAIVCYDKMLGGYNSFFGGIISSNIDSKFKWLIEMSDFDKGNMFESILKSAKEGFKSDTNLSSYISMGFSGYSISYLLDLTDELIDTLYFDLCLSFVDLKLNDIPSTTKTDVSQPGNTYQIFETTDQKIYWGTGEDADKLVFEIPMDFPEQTTDGAKITNIKISDVYKNPDYLATENATTENATSGT